MSTSKGPRKAKKTTTVVEEIPAIEESAEESEGRNELDFSLEEIQSAEQLDKLQAIIEQFPNCGITAKLYDSEGMFCYRIVDPSANELEETVRKRCGAGEFQIRLYVNGKYRQSIPLPIRQLLPSDTEQSTPHGASTDAIRHAEFLERQAQRNHELLLAAIGANKGSSGPSITELTTALSQLDQLRGKQEDAFALFKKGIDMANSLSGKSDWKTDLLHVLGDAVPPIAAAFAGKTIPPPNPQQPDGSTPTMPQPTQPQISEAVLKQGIAYLKKKCVNGTDPQLIIDWVVDNAEDEQYQILLGEIFRKDFAEFAKHDPEIATGPFLPWFTQLYDGLRSAFSPANPMDVDSGRDMGDTVDTGNNGKPREGGSAK